MARKCHNAQPESDKARKHAADGTGIIGGDFENIDSMMKAFTGVRAIPP